MFVISRTPVRISLLGGGTDYPDFFLEHGGAVLGTTIDQYIHISIKTLKSAFFDHSIRVAYSTIECVKEVQEIVHPSVRESLLFHELTENLDINVFADLPARTGLGSSSAFTVGFLHALHALKGQRVSKEHLAEEACHVEQKRIGEAVGSQDSYHAALGGWNFVEFTSKGITVNPLHLDFARLDTLASHFMLFYTGITRSAPQLAAQQIQGIKEKSNIEFLKELKRQAYQAKELIQNEKLSTLPEQLGLFLHEAWQLKRQLCRGISTPQIESAYETARKAGAYGGKLCGAGGGGFLLFVAPLDSHESVRKALWPYPQVPFRFDNEGSSILYQKKG